MPGRDISSVTGSPHETFRCVDCGATGKIERAAIQREALDAFIRDELPVLLDSISDLEYLSPEKIAAKVAELRSGRETG